MGGKKSSADCFSGLHLRWHAIKHGCDETFSWLSWGPSVQRPRANISVDQTIYLSHPQMNGLPPSLPRNHHVPWAFHKKLQASPGIITSAFPSQCRDDKSTLLSPVPPRATVLMIYGPGWRQNKRPQRDRHKGGGEAAQHRKTLNRETF